MRRSYLQIILAMLLFATAWALSAPTPGTPLAAVVDAETRFAKMSEDQGWVAAFIANFAEEGVNFTPHPTRTKERLSKDPPADSGPKTVLH